MTRQQPISDERILEILNNLQHTSGLIATLGITFDTSGESVTSQMTIRDEHTGAPGVAHGGCVAALLDSALGACALEHALRRGKLTSTVELKTNFLRPALLGQTLVTETTIQSAGRSLLVISGAARDAGTGEQIAFAVGTFNLYNIDRAHRPEDANL